MFSRASSWLVLVAVWTIIGGLLTLELFLTLRTMHSDVSLWSVVIGQFMRVSFWVAFTPCVFWLQRRAPISRETYLWAIPLHVLLSVAAMALIYLARLLVAFAYYREDLGEYWMRVVSEFYGRNLVDVPIYWTVLGAAYTSSILERFRQEHVRSVQLEKDLAEAEVMVLKAQLQPHFLFNTLNTIAVLVREEQNREAVSLIARLSSLLRMAFETTGQQEVTVRQEVDFLRRYLDIQSARFTDRLKVEFDIDPEMNDALVPTLILQPLAENAVIHGFSSRARPGRIQIGVAQEGENLRLSVADDGPGFDPQNGSARQGIGLPNTRGRLARMYDDRASLECRNRDEGGAQVVVILPLRRNGREHESGIERSDA